MATGRQTGREVDLLHPPRHQTGPQADLRRRQDNPHRHQHDNHPLRRPPGNHLLIFLLLRRLPGQVHMEVVVEVAPWAVVVPEAEEAAVVEDVNYLVLFGYILNRVKKN